MTCSVVGTVLQKDLVDLGDQGYRITFTGQGLYVSVVAPFNLVSLKFFIKVELGKKYLMTFYEDSLRTSEYP